MPAPQHIPVMCPEVLEGLALREGAIAVDGTLGGGGHTRAMAEIVGMKGLVIAMDRDPAACDAAAENLRGCPVKLIESNYADLPEILQQLETPAVDGIVLDLGLSSDQLADRDRGFSFDADGPLDLRFNPTSGEPAWKMLERMSQEQLANVIYEYGEERKSRRIARRIVEQRRTDPIRTTGQLADLVRRCVPRERGRPGFNPSTRTFQALRIAVNDELKWLDVALERFPECLAIGGRLAMISFHSLEDRRVKNAFRDDPRYEVLTKKPIRPSPEEVATNPRARSAKLRVARRIA